MIKILLLACILLSCNQSTCYTNIITGPDGWTKRGDLGYTKSAHLSGRVTTTISFTADFEGEGNVVIGLMGSTNDYNLIAHQMTTGKNVFTENTDNVPEGDYTITVDFRSTSENLKTDVEMIQVENKVCNE